MTGGPSHIDMFDPKPGLAKYAGQRPDRRQPAHRAHHRRPAARRPSSSSSTARAASRSANCCRNLAAIADDLCVVRSMYTFNPTHTPARSLFHSGNIAATRPSMGSWISYGLGTENQNLPGFVVLSPGGGGGPGLRSGFLPARLSGHRRSTIPSPIRRR